MAFIDELKAKQRTDDIVKEIQEEFDRWFDSAVQGYVTEEVAGIKKKIVEKVEKGEKGNISGEWGIRDDFRFLFTKELDEKINKYDVSLKLPEGVSTYGRVDGVTFELIKVEYKKWTEKKKVLFWERNKKRRGLVACLNTMAKKIFVDIEKLAAQEGIKLDLNKIRCERYSYDSDNGYDHFVEKFVLQGVNSFFHKTRRVMGVERFKILIPYSIEL